MTTTNIEVTYQVTGWTNTGDLVNHRETKEIEYNLDSEELLTDRIKKEFYRDHTNLHIHLI